MSDIAETEQLVNSGSLPVPPVPIEFRYTQSESFVALLHELGASLLVSTYQANKLLVVRASKNGLSTLVRTFDKPMGVAVNDANGTRDSQRSLAAAQCARHRATGRAPWNARRMLSTALVPHYRRHRYP